MNTTSVMIDHPQRASNGPVERVDTIVIGGGQAGLAMGYYLARQGCNFVILDAHKRIGNSWRTRWDSLRLFTMARYDGLPGMPFPAPWNHLPSKDEMADYLEAYAAHFHLPVRLNTPVDALDRDGQRYLVTAGDQCFEARRVVVATGPFHMPRIPTFASMLDPAIQQFHSRAYRHPDQLPDGDVLVVGMGNSGVEIALELAQTRRTWLSGQATGHLPQIRNRLVNRFYWWLVHRVLTVDRWLGRRFKAVATRGGAPLIGVSEQGIERAGIKRVPRTIGVKKGLPLVGDGRVLEVAGVVWATGLVQDFRWIRLPVFDDAGTPVHYRGIVEREPGLYFLGLPFLYTLTSHLVGGVGRDAAYIADHIASQPVPVDVPPRSQRAHAHETHVL